MSHAISFSVCCFRTSSHCDWIVVRTVNAQHVWVSEICHQSMELWPVIIMCNLTNTNSESWKGSKNVSKDFGSLGRHFCFHVSHHQFWEETAARSPAFTYVFYENWQFSCVFFNVFINFMANSSEKIIVKLVFVKRLRHPGPAFSRCKTLPTVCNLWAKKNIMICVRVQSALLRSHRPEGNYYTSQYSRDLLAANLTFVTNAIGCGTVLSFLVSLPKLHVMCTCIKYKFLIFGN